MVFSISLKGDSSHFSNGRSLLKDEQCLLMSFLYIQVISLNIGPYTIWSNNIGANAIVII